MVEKDGTKHNKTTEVTLQQLPKQNNSNNCEFVDLFIRSCYLSAVIFYFEKF